MTGGGCVLRRVLSAAHIEATRTRQMALRGTYALGLVKPGTGYFDKKKLSITSASIPEQK